MGSMGMASPPPCRCCNCGVPLLGLRVPSRTSVFAPERPSWMSRLADADFSKACVADRVCNTCGGAAFCEHCCAEHHRGHDTAVAAADHAAALAHRRDSFCTGCRVAFCSELCAHHAAGEGHEVIPVDDYDRWYCARCTGSERWFPVFDGVQTFRDERGNLLVPLHWKPAALPDAECRAWVTQLFAEDFSKPCVTDRVCNTCGGAGFCEHCCVEHHRGHDTAVAAAPTAHKRGSFCIGCRVAFRSDLCAHHHAVGGGGQSHEVIPIDGYDGWHFARCTGSERWFLAAFGGIKTFRDKRGNVLVPMNQKRAAVPRCPSWFSKLITMDFSKTCTRDRVCNTCGGAGFCGHCCGEHHRGHDTTAATDDTAAATVHKRDSFCIDCRVAFSSDLCAHHAAGGEGEGHEVIPIDEFDMWYCARSTGSEWWFFTAFLGGPTFQDKGNVLVPLRQREMAYPEPVRMHGVMVQDGEECPSWMYHLVNANFYKTCARDRVCNTCGGAAFCGHCCGEHHRGHDTATATAASEGHRRDSFCIGCGVDFCSELCAHHAGHEVIPIDAYGDRHFVRSTGSESWFTTSAFGEIETFEDKDGNLMVPLEQKMSKFPEPGLWYRYETHHHGGTTTPPTAPSAEPMLVC